MREEPELGEKYDASIDAYDGIYSELSRRKYMILLDLLGDGEVLDVGVGAGYICLYAGERYGIGIDLSLESLRRASDRCGSLDLVLCDVRTPILRRRLDVGVSVSTCHHIMDRCIDILDRYSYRWAAGYIGKFISNRLLEEAEANGWEVMELWDEIFILRR